LLAEAKPDYLLNVRTAVFGKQYGDWRCEPLLQKKLLDYNIESSQTSTKMGIKEVQFDYVRFPEGFETSSDSLSYTRGAL